MHFLDLDEIQNIPSNWTVTYAPIVVDYRLQKKDPNCVQITVGGNLINYPTKLITRTADLTTSKILWNSVISTPRARFAATDIKYFYLNTLLNQYEYTCMPIKLIPQAFIDQYKLLTKVNNGFVYVEI